MSFSAQVMQLNKGYENKLLSEQQQDELLNWDAEKYRKNMNRVRQTMQIIIR